MTHATSCSRFTLKIDKVVGVGYSVNVMRRAALSLNFTTGLSGFPNTLSTHTIQLRYLVLFDVVCADPNHENGRE